MFKERKSQMCRDLYKLSPTTPWNWKMDGPWGPPKMSSLSNWGHFSLPSFLGDFRGGFLLKQSIPTTFAVESEQVNLYVWHGHFYDLEKINSPTCFCFASRVCLTGLFLKVTFFPKKKQFPTTSWILRCFDCQDHGVHWWDNHLPQCTMAAPVVAVLCIFSAVASSSRGAQLQNKSAFCHVSSESY